MLKTAAPGISQPGRGRAKATPGLPDQYTVRAAGDRVKRGGTVTVKTEVARQPCPPITCPATEFHVPLRRTALFSYAPRTTALGCGQAAAEIGLSQRRRPPVERTDRRGGADLQRAHAVEKPVDHMWGARVTGQ